jgi:hypothetical protein
MLELDIPAHIRSTMVEQETAGVALVDGAVVGLATLPDSGPTGGFFRDGRSIAF